MSFTGHDLKSADLDSKYSWTRL